MATIYNASELKINGGNSYTGPGPITLTWTPFNYSGSSLSTLTIRIDDGDSWGEAGYPAFSQDIFRTSYTFTSSNIDHVKNSPSGKATISISLSGWDRVTDEYVVYKSNEVIYTYAETEPVTSYTVRCYINNQWQDCVIYYYNGTSWEECIPYYYDGSTWQTCSF